jgi:hypothetical protein
MSGKKKPRKLHPALPVSTEVEEDFFIIDFPQLKQTSAPSFNSLPHIEQ